MALTADELRDQETVKRWIANVDARFHLSECEWQERLTILAEFCADQGMDPDAIIAEARADRAQKINHMRRLRHWVAAAGLDDRRAHDRQNVIRSFFINNGARVITKPYPDVYRRTT